MKRFFLVVAMAAALGAAVGAAGPAGCGTAPSTQLNQNAAADTLTTLRPHLDAVAQAHPEQAAAVASLEAAWTTQTERQDLVAATPFLKIREQDVPALADALEAKLWAWDQRLTKLGQ